MTLSRYRAQATLVEASTLTTAPFSAPPCNETKRESVSEIDWLDKTSLKKQTANPAGYFDDIMRSKTLKEYSRKHFTAPSSHCGEKSWSQIPGGVDGVTAIKSKSGANDKHDQPNHDRYQPLVGRIVVLVYDGKDTADKESSAKQLKTKTNAHENLNSYYTVQAHC